MNAIQLLQLQPANRGILADLVRNLMVNANRSCPLSVRRCLEELDHQDD